MTFAVETASPRLRRVINKHIFDEELLQAAFEAFSKGWRLLKLYFMIGLPTETMEDIDGMIDLIYAVSDESRKVNGRNGNLNVSVSCFVPKAHTPFQWEGFRPIEEFEEKISYIKSKIRRKFIKLSFHEPERSFLEAIFARGDRRMSKAVYEAWKSGCKFDYWTEEFNLGRWRDAFAKAGLDPDELASRKLEYDEVLPWEHISPGVSKEYLRKEHERAYREEWTEDCFDAKCLNCGNVCRSMRVAGRGERLMMVERDIRITYTKEGVLRYIGHLDTTRVLTRALARSSMPVLYSQGFSPHMKVSFGPPLPLGYTSEMELAEVSMDDADAAAGTEEWRGELQSFVPAGMRIVSLKYVEDGVPPVSKAIDRAEYEIMLPGTVFPFFR